MLRTEAQASFHHPLLVSVYKLDLLHLPRLFLSCFLLPTTSSDVLLNIAHHVSQERYALSAHARGRTDATTCPVVLLSSRSICLTAMSVARGANNSLPAEQTNSPPPPRST